MQSADLDALLNQYFKGRVVRKDLTKAIERRRQRPCLRAGAFTRMYCASDDDEVVMEGLENVKKSWL